MNIFVLDRDPELAAQALCDKHVPKMLLESVQILCTVSYLLGRPGPYRPTHVNHPCVKWVLERFGNCVWLYRHALEVQREYERRFKREHASADKLLWFWCHGDWPSFGLNLTPFAQVMPDQYKIPADPVAAYRAYYIGEKSRFARWERGTRAPVWWPQ